MKIKILADGGSMKPGPALSQQLGPAGININEVITKVNEATEGFKGMKVPVTLDVDPDTKAFEIEISSPPVSELLKKEFGIKKASGMQKKVQVANASIEQVISVAKTKMPNLLCNDLRSSIKTVVGTCGSLGILIENKMPVDIEKDIESGIYDKEIEGEKTETSVEKKKKLDENFSKIEELQKNFLKELEEKKAAKKK